MTALEALAGRLARTRFEELEPEAVEAARLRLFDTVACFAAGAASPEGRALRGVLDAVPSGLPERIRFACGATRCTEIDDIHIGSCTTVGSMVVPATLLAAADAQASDRDLLCGLVAGYEAMARLGSAVDGALRIYQGVWSSCLTAPFGVAAAIARLHGFDTPRTAHALATAAARSTGITGRAPAPFGSRWFAIACAAADGLLATQAAGAGLIGDLAILDGAFTRATGVPVKTDLLTGDGWAILDIDCKPFRTSRQALSATEAFRQAAGKRPVAEVLAWVPEHVKAMVDNPSFPLGVQHQIALAASDPAALCDVAHADRRHEAIKVSVEADPKLTALYPRQWGGRVEVRFADGGTASAEVLDPPGSARAPYSWDQLLAKHQAVANASGLPADWLEPALSLCRTLGSGSSARELLGLRPSG